MHTKIESILISISPNENGIQSMQRKYKEITGTDDSFFDRDLHLELYRENCQRITLENVSMHEAQIFAEPLRIANPDQCVSLYGSDSHFIGNTSWNDQMKMFFEYPTYTEYGTYLANKRQEEAKKLNIKASWE
jgi:hypothetical protein